ncbi:MAG: DICT sensory domain-containing protein [Acidobacteriota bacterium]
MSAPIAKTFEDIVHHLDARTERNGGGLPVTETDTFRTLNFSLMLSISHYIEDRFIEKRLSGLFVASFQKLSLFLPQQERYAAIASTSQQVWIIGEPDITLPFIGDNLLFFRPADAECRDYWIVLSDDLRFRIALFARERHLPEAASVAPFKNGHAVGKKRRFEGFWTYRDEYIDAIRASIQAHYARPDFRVLPQTDPLGTL